MSMTFTRHPVHSKIPQLTKTMCGSCENSTGILIHCWVDWQQNSANMPTPLLGGLVVELRKYANSTAGWTGGRIPQIFQLHSWVDWSLYFHNVHVFLTCNPVVVLSIHIQVQMMMQFYLFQTVYCEHTSRHTYIHAMYIQIRNTVRVIACHIHTVCGISVTRDWFQLSISHNQTI